jgi:hypothetical protein
MMFLDKNQAHSQKVTMKLSHFNEKHVLVSYSTPDRLDISELLNTRST